MRLRIAKSRKSRMLRCIRLVSLMAQTCLRVNYLFTRILTKSPTSLFSSIILIREGSLKVFSSSTIQVRSFFRLENRIFSTKDITIVVIKKGFSRSRMSKSTMLSQKHTRKCLMRKRNSSSSSACSSKIMCFPVEITESNQLISMQNNYWR